MSRRDTIIIAVLLNAGLLIVLFATSLKTESLDVPSSRVTLVSPSANETGSPLAVATLPKDEVDQVLQQYVPPIPAATLTETPNFAADLQAIGVPVDSNVNPLVVAPLSPTSEAVSPLVPQASSPMAAVPQQGEVNYKEVKVKKGDVLERIARTHRVTVDELMKANHLSSTRLKIGQVLKVPTKIPAAGSVLGQTPKRSETSSTKYYTVKAGDNPWTIAVKNHMKVEELLKLNDLDADKARRLKAGDQLRIQ